METLFSFLDTQRETVITWQKEMTKRPALGPENNGNGEVEKAQWITCELEAMGIPALHQFPCPDSRVPSGMRPNIAAIIPGKSQKTLWILAHMDVVPPGEISLWRTNPYEVHIDGDFIIGRGVEDNQQGIVSALLVAKALLHYDICPTLSLGLLFIADEETGMEYGLPHILQEHPQLINQEDMVVVPDIGNDQGSFVQIAEKSSLWLKFTVHGKQCHASTPQLGLNSLVVASACILALEELYRTFRQKDPLFAPSWSTFVPSKKESNVDNINTLPGKDIFYLDCRILPQYNPDDVLQECKRIANTVALNYATTIDIEVVQALNSPAATPEKAEVVTKLQAALQATRGVQGIPGGSGGQTLASSLRAKGIPTVAWSTVEPNPHAPNERSRISHTIADAKTLLHMLMA